VGRSLELGQHLLMGKGEEASGGRERPTNLAAAFEAVAGALFLDQGYDAAKTFVLRTVGTELEGVVKQRPPRHAKTALQELVQSMGMAPPTYSILEATGPDHAREYTAEVMVGGEVKGTGTGSRKSLAEQRAAEEALKALGQRL
jgi:ribonuclease-3